MKTHEQPTDDRAQDPMPKALRDDLQSLYGAPAMVPQATDDAILGQARELLKPRRARTRRIRRIVGTVAALVLVGVVVSLLMRSQEQSPLVGRASDKPAVAGDIDADGQVNILDAFAMARRIESAEGAPPAWDVNGDGKVNGEDVAHVARLAVRLDEGAL